MAQRSAGTIKRLRFSQWKIDNRVDELEEFLVGRFLIKIVGLVAYGVALAALHPVIVVIEHFLKRAAVNHRLIALETFALFSFEGFDRDRAKFDSLDGAPRID